jgi:branched-chain amino acid transport system ATP-binding protein
MDILEINELSKNFGGLTALYRVNFNVMNSEIVGLIGPNGAGKTTLFNVITGFHRPTSGEIIFNGINITGYRPDQIARIGVARTFQQTALFMEATVFDNVFIGFYLHYKEPGWKAPFHTPAVRNEEQTIKSKVTELLDLMGLTPFKDELAVNLPHGYQRILGICIALGSNPTLLLLDEPLTGMNPTEAFAMVDLIRNIKKMGITIFVVEHNMKAVMKLCERIVVLNYGQMIAQGLPEEIMTNERVIEAYLGKEEEWENVL